MKNFLIVSLASLISVGCGASSSPTTANNTNSAVVQSSTAANARPSSDSPIVSSHSTTAPKSDAPSADKPASTSEQSPMARPIDVAQMNAAIEKAEAEYKKNPKAKEALAKAYFTRATALTDAAQYRSALGDYRKGLKLDPNDEDARKMHDQIISIFQQIGREPPKEGEEPKPLPAQ